MQRTNIGRRSGWERKIGQDVENYRHVGTKTVRNNSIGRRGIPMKLLREI